MFVIPDFQVELRNHDYLMGKSQIWPFHSDLVSDTLMNVFRNAGQYRAFQSTRDCRL